MKGTEKQVKWAKDIKSKMSEIENAYDAEFEAFKQTPVFKNATEEQLANLYGTDSKMRRLFEMAQNEERAWVIIEMFKDCENCKNIRVHSMMAADYPEYNWKNL